MEIENDETRQNLVDVFERGNTLQLNEMPVFASHPDERNFVATQPSQAL
jgi:hypothetical protein